MALPNKTCPWYAWKRPDLNLAHVHCFGVYVKGNDQRCNDPLTATPLSTVVENMTTMLRSCEQFHKEQLPGSVLTWSIHGPVELPMELDSLNGEIGANAYFNLGSSIIRILSSGTTSYNGNTDTIPGSIRKDNTFPPLLYRSNYIESIPGSMDTLSSTVDGTVIVKGTLNTLPTHCVFALFSDYGQEATSSVITTTSTSSTDNNPCSKPPLDLLRKYFIWNAAEPVATMHGQSCEEYLSTVYRTGGSRASFFGTVPVHTLWSALSTAKLVIPLSPESNQTMKTVYRINTLLPNQYSTDNNRNNDHPLTIDDGGPLTIGLGIGIVTREAWLHGTEIPSCSAVVYHEAIGHGSNMPHPSTRSPLCVMDAGMYTRQSLHGSTVCICDEIKRNMKDEEEDEETYSNHHHRTEPTDTGSHTSSKPNNGAPVRRKETSPPGSYVFTESIPLPSRQYSTTQSTPGPFPSSTSTETNCTGMSSKHSISTMIVSRTLSRFQGNENNQLTFSSALPLYVSWMYTDEDTSDNSNVNHTVTCLRRTEPVAVADDAMCYICKTNIVETIYRLYMKYDPNHAKASMNSSSTIPSATSTSSKTGSSSSTVGEHWIPAEWIEPSTTDCLDSNIISNRIAQLCRDTLNHVQAETQKKIDEEKETADQKKKKTSVSTTSDDAETLIAQGKSILIGQMQYPWEETSSCITSMIDILPEMKRIRATDVYHFKEIILGTVSGTVPSSSSSSSSLHVSTSVKIMDTVQRLFNRICPLCLSTPVNSSDQLTESHSWQNIVDELGLVKIMTGTLSGSHQPLTQYYIPILDDGRNIAILLPLFHDVALISGTGTGISLLQDSSVSLTTLANENLFTALGTVQKNNSQSFAAGAFVPFYGFHSGQWVYGLPS